VAALDRESFNSSTRWFLGLAAVGATLVLPGVAHGFNVTATDSTVNVTSGPTDEAVVRVHYLQAQRSDTTGGYAQTIEVSTSDGLGNGSPDRCESVSGFQVRCHLAHFSGALDPGTAPVLTADVPFSLTLTGKNELQPAQARPIVGSVTSPGGRVTLGGGQDDVGAFTVDFSGGGGEGTVDSGPGDDTIKGGPGRDLFFLRSGDRDTVTGGAGNDFVSYVPATAGVTARIGGAAGDDAIGADIENLQGSDFVDQLTGDDGPNRIEASNKSINYIGGPGASGDQIDARGGDDIISVVTPTTFAQSAPSVIHAGGGNDRVVTGRGTSEIFGETGDDTIFALFGTDVADGGGGNDLVIGSSQLDPPSGADDLRGGDDADTISYLAGSVVPVTVDLQAGTGGPTGAQAGQLDSLAGFENATGDFGDDTLIGDGRANVLRGDRGDDRLVGGGDADVLDGGEGRDDADYSQATAAVQVRLDGLANDGASAEGDDVQATIEVIEGGPFGDTLVGDESDERLIGNDGDDTIDGGLGADEIFGGGGSDTVDYSRRTLGVSVDPEAGPIPPPDDGGPNERDAVSADIERVLGGAGDDTLIGGPGAQSLFGGDGADLLVGGPDADLLVGDDGDDTLASADDVEDRDRCGAGTDGVAADTLDTVDADCENVTRAAAGSSGGGGAPSGGATGPAAQPNPFFTVSISRRTVTLTTAGVAGVPVSCPPQAAGGCQGVITLQTANGIPVVVIARKQKRRIVKLGRASFDIPAGTTRTVRVRLSKRNQKLLRKLHRVKVRATIQPRAGQGEKSVRTFTLKAAPRRRGAA
jgi:Ca2+-binding RTX toxin-like protein